MPHNPTGASCLPSGLYHDGHSESGHVGTLLRRGGCGRGGCVPLWPLLSWRQHYPLANSPLQMPHLPIAHISAVNELVTMIGKAALVLVSHVAYMCTFCLVRGSRQKAVPSCGLNTSTRHFWNNVCPSSAWVQKGSLKHLSQGNDETQVCKETL